jgi:hypothetical protein
VILHQNDEDVTCGVEARFGSKAETQ